MLSTTEISNRLAKHVREKMDQIILQEMEFHGFTIQDAIEAGEIQYHPVLKAQTVRIKGRIIVTFIESSLSDYNENTLTEYVSYQIYRDNRRAK